MKRINILLTISLFIACMCFEQALVAQTHHYRYAYLIMSDGSTKESFPPAYAIEYSITYSSNINGFYFSTPNGSPLDKAFILNLNGALMTFNSSNNNCSYVGTVTLNQPSGKFKKYTVSVHKSSIFNGVVLNDENINESIYVSNDGNTLVIGSNLVYTRIATRSIPNHVSGSQSSQPTNNGGGSYNYNNSYNNSYNYNSSNQNNSSSSTGDRLVGNFQAFGISDGITGGTVTHSSSFPVYQYSNGGYYVKSGWKMSTLSTNGKSSHSGYSVSQYNYFTVIDGVVWYFRIY